MVAPGSTAALYIADFNALPGSRVPSVESMQTPMERAWAAYVGDMPNPLIVKPNQPDDNLKYNGASVIVDTGVSFLFGRGFAFTLDGDDTTRSPAEAYLDQVWQANNQNDLAHKLAINGAVCGSAFLKIHLANPYPKLYPIDPAKITVVTAADDASYALQYVIRWRGVDAKGNTVDYRQVITRQPAADPTDQSEQAPPTETWLISDQKAVNQPRFLRQDDIKWVEIGREDWPYPFAPIVDCQNLFKPNAYIGKADLSDDVVHLLDKINRTLSNIAKILRIHAHPRTWSRGLNETQIKQLSVDVERIINLPGDTATLQNLEMESDLASSINFYYSLRQALYELTRVPEIASGKIADLQYMSAMAMQILYGPLIEKTNAKRQTYGGLIAELHRRLLIIAGIPIPPQPTHIVWPEVFPRDALVESQTAMNLLQVGVSQDTLLEEMGYDIAKERARRAIDLQEQIDKQTKLTAAGVVAPPGPTQGAKAPTSGGQTVPAKTGNPDERTP